MSDNTYDKFKPKNDALKNVNSQYFKKSESVVKVNNIRLSNKYIVDLINEVHKKVIGQDELIVKAIVALLSNAHLLIEGVPGLAKTLLISTLGSVLDLDFKRIQFTPDLLPSDITGGEIVNEKGMFVIKKGPVFCNLLLADEINRAPPKVQSALLESMQERQVTLGNKIFKLPQPFFVLATQNPIENQGTYPLPEAEMDRFMMKVFVDYPSISEEIQILGKYGENNEIKLNKVLNAETILKLQKEVKDVYIDGVVKEYIVRLVDATRYPEKYGVKKLIQFGASPRASLYLTLGAKAVAYLQNRDYVIPDDVEFILKDVLRHRIILSYDAQIDNVSTDDFIAMIDEAVEKP